MNSPDSIKVLSNPFIKLRTMTMQTVSLVLSIIAFVTSVGFSILTLKDRKANHTQYLYNQFQLSLNTLMDISQDYYLLELEPPEQKASLAYTRKINSLQNKRATTASHANQLARQLKNQISSSEYTELAKAFYTLHENETATHFHTCAITSGEELSKVVARRSFADFLFLTDRVSEGRTQYQECINQFDQTTDRNKKITVKTLQMWMYNEAKIENRERAKELAREAASIIERVSDAQSRKDLKQELENVMASCNLYA